MAHSQLDDAQLISKIAEVFRTHGYEGTSLSRLSEATGLEKASLYHRFPGGKEEIAVAVVESVNRWFAAEIFAALEGPGEPAARVRTVARRLREFYGEGQKSCTLDTMSLPAGSEALQRLVEGSAAALLDAFTAVAKAGGANQLTSRRRAEQAIIELEGSLVLSRVTGNPKPFLRAMDALPALLTN